MNHIHCELYYIPPDIHNIYVANSGSNDVSVLHKRYEDMDENHEYYILDTVNVGTIPSAIIYSYNNYNIYVANSGSNDVSVIDEYHVEAHQVTSNYNINNV
ncbi:MAG: hypothetical protein WAM14_26555 [Candidatus Nitrosopolaris sp.]